MTAHLVKSIVRPLAALALAALLVPAAARAGEFGTNNIQLLQGWTFDKDINATGDKALTTITLNHYATFSMGDNFAFVDYQRGRFTPFATGKTEGVANSANLYAEWHPRLFLNKAFGTGEAGVVKNWGLAGEVNMSSGFYAYLAGVTADFAIPGFAVAGLSAYYRYEFVGAALDFGKAYTSTWQISPWWTVPFKIGPTDWVFTGFVDVTTNHDKDIDVMAQPELLLDVGAFAGAPGKLHLGIEWYVHSFKFNGESRTTSAPQAMIQWTAF